MIDVPEDVWQDTVEIFRSCGQGRRECVVYWVGPSSDDLRVVRPVHPVHTATPRHYEVDGAWLTQLWVELARRGESVLAQVHTHRGQAGHSTTDDQGAIVYQAGFLSLVLPWFAMKRDSRRGVFLAELSSAGAWEEIEVGKRLRWS